mgnify:CR=1 FL=1
MTDKSHTTPDGPFALSNHRLMALTGRDAVAFAQAQFMNDVSLLGNGQWQWNGWLTPKGRVIALFALVHAAPSRFLMVLPDFPAEELAARMKRFVFRSKLSLLPLDDWHACAGPAPSGPDRALAAGDAGTGWVLDLSGDGASRAAARDRVVRR